MDRLGFNSGNSGILESTREYSGITQGSYGNDSGMTREYLGDSGRVWDITDLSQRTKLSMSTSSPSWMVAHRPHEQGTSVFLPSSESPVLA